MGKIKSSTKEVFTTTDGEDFTNMDKARKHQIDISEENLTPKLEKMIEKMFSLPTTEEINAAYDSNDDDFHEKSDRMEEKIGDFLSVQCKNVGWFDDMDDLASALIGTYQAFGMEKLSEIFMFIHDRMNT